MALSSAFAQESLSKLSSYISRKLADVASRETMVTKMEMAVLKLEFAIERSQKLPITEASLLRRRDVIKRACIEGKELLRTHKQQLEGREEVGHQMVTSSSFLGRVTRAVNRSMLSLLGFDKGYSLSSSAVEKFEQFAEWADKFLEDVQSGCSLRHHMISNNPLVRLLFEWKTLGWETKKGTFVQSALIWTTLSEERGVEASLLYMYEDPKMTAKSFHLRLVLRLSESTDIIGTAIKCLQPLVSQFKVAAESAIGELSQLATATSDILELSPWRVDVVAPLKKHCGLMFHISRLDPICCWSNDHDDPSGDNIVSSKLPRIYPEEVTFLEFNFHLFSERMYNLRRSSGEAAGRSVTLPLKLQVTFMPHFDVREVLRQRLGIKRSALIEVGCNHNHSLMSIEQVLDTVGSNTAMQSYLNRPVLIDYRTVWFWKHGAAAFDVRKPTTQRRNAKRKR